MTSNRPEHLDSDSQGGPILQSVERSTAHYLEQMEALSLEQLRRQPADDEWSLGQMLLHLAQAALRMQFENARRSLADADTASEPAPAPSEEDSPTGKTEAGEATFRAGSFPPDPVKVPASPQYTPLQPGSKAQIRAALEEVLEALRELEPEAARSASQRTALHPRLGGLTAAEWLRLTEMHYRHHRLQEARLLAWLEAGPATAR
ncbi:hypothetical protein CDO73_04715 [Saccharibacillus sp. O23]|uniref:DinB family protein n=1 Tax=Saccharibacillus sp. O23 TaxID=2009338 RepID=UPI000B4E2B95|nr:DinB family protein [Saccharibacillus sp. O23]OWR31787.1 hypothetical protein CDO73_04715 [Saccharibacillus sp. O23]